MNKKEKGITLVALIITIIILIILAGVSIKAVMNGGLIKNSKDARNQFDEAKEKEDTELSKIEMKEEIEQISGAIRKKIAENTKQQLVDNNFTLDDLDIPDSLKEKYLEYFTYSGSSIRGFSDMGRAALENGMTYFIIPSEDKNGAAIYSIYQGAFSSQTGIEGIIVSSGITGLGGMVFRYCTNLEYLVLPNSLTGIGFESFMRCTALSGEINIPSDVTSIGYHAFRDDTKINKVVIPSTVTSIGQRAFGTLVYPSGMGCDIYVPFANEEEMIEAWGSGWYSGGDAVNFIYTEEDSE